MSDTKYFSELLDDDPKSFDAEKFRNLIRLGQEVYGMDDKEYCHHLLIPKNTLPIWKHRTTRPLPGVTEVVIERFKQNFPSPSNTNLAILTLERLEKVTEDLLSENDTTIKNLIERLRLVIETLDQ